MKICAITGAGGWLGSRTAATIQRAGWQVRRLERTPRDAEDRRFALGAEVPPETLAGCDALVHCAYDFRPVKWSDIETVNVRGTERLLTAARVAGVRRITVVSTMSAFTGCVSLYGRAKLAIEAAGRDAGALLLRPGLIYGDDSGGMFGRLVAQVRGGRFQPVFGGGRQMLNLIHEQDLCDFIQRHAAGEVETPAQPLTAAHEKSWAFRAILEALAGALGRRIAFVTVPWRGVWLALKCAELCGLRLGFRSDSLVSLMNQNPRPDFSANEGCGLRCRAFDATSLRL